MTSTNNNRRQASVSIVVPCFNGSRHLHETLESVVNQTVRPLEVVVVDDGSTDESVDVAAAFAPAVRVIRQQNQGVSVARNTGLKHTSGDYVIFLDHDDLLARGALAEMCQRLEQNPASAIVMSFVSFEEKPQDPCRTWRATTIDAFFPHLLNNCIANPSAWLFPRQTVLDAGGFDSSVRIYQFWHFLCKVALTGVRLVPVDFIGAYYRQSPTSMIHSAPLTQVTRGQVHVQTLLCGEILRSHPDLLEKHGELMFWSAWAAMHRARACKLPEHETAELVEAIGEIARRGPAPVRTTRFARTIRLVGAPWAERIRSLLHRDS